jgi:hypothetical protein
MSAWTRLTFACVLGSFCGAALADSSRTEFEQSFIGREWITGYGSSDLCKPLGGYVLRSNKSFGISSFICDGRELVVLEQYMTRYAMNTLDALLLPKLKPGELLMVPGECELNGKTDLDFLVLARLGRREKVTGKNGLRAAWMFNAETGKIEELSTKNIVCWCPTLP